MSSLYIRPELRPEDRAVLLPHARHFLTIARRLRLPHLREAELPWVRTIKLPAHLFRKGVVFYNANGLGLEFEIFTTQFDGYMMPHSFLTGLEPLDRRLRSWRRTFKRNRDRLDIRQRAILTAILYLR